MGEAPWRVLLVDDDEDDYVVTRDLLAELGPRWAKLEWEATYEAALKEMLRGQHDAYLVDYRLGERDGLELLREARAAGCTVPIIFLTGTGGYDVDVEATKAGAADYLVKGEITGALLERSIRHAVERNRNLQALAEARNYAQNLIDSSLDMIIAVNRERRIVEFNRAAEQAFGLSRQEVLDQHVGMLYQDPGESARVAAALEQTGRFTGEVTNKRKSGQAFPSFLSASALHDAQGKYLGVMGVSRDITELKNAQAELESTLALVARSREDMLAILDQLRLGIVMTDRNGRVVFLSQACQQLLGRSEDVSDVHWEELCPFEQQDKRRLKAMLARPPEQREKVPVHMEAPDGRHYWMEVEVQDDPREAERKIFFLYDMTEIYDLRQQLDEKARFQDLVGKSAPMQAVYQQILDLATVDSTVLIVGDTGTGKELVARAIHSLSHRKDKPFIAVNCAALTESLLDSRLFGHKRGAFTGAIEDQVGVFETANGGTVFLDEVGDISASVQTSLLRVLQEKEITRLGEARPRKIDVRIIAATHRDLSKEVESGRFRLDLLYRIRVAPIQLPPLHERRVDIPLLVESFLRKARAATGKPIERVCDEALGMLLNHSWPGNVRELQSAIEFAVIHSRGAVIQPGDLPPEISKAPLTHQPPGDPRDEERQRVLAALDAAKGNRAVAARLLGMSRSTLYRRLAELEIKVD